jgi:hypothetical protein
MTPSDAPLPADARPAPATPVRPYGGRTFVWVTGLFAVIALTDVYALLAGPAERRRVADLVMHLAMVAGFSAVAWTGGAPAESSRRRVGTAVSLAALVAMVASFAWKLRAG